MIQVPHGKRRRFQIDIHGATAQTKIRKPTQPRSTHFASFDALSVLPDNVIDGGQ